MSGPHSGINPSSDLENAWSAAQRNESLRVLVVAIENESLVPKQTLDKEASAAEDYGRLQSLVEPNVPAFLLFRLDEGTWLLVIYVPDVAPVRQKMLYASTRANLTRTLGESLFSDSLHAHSPDDLTSTAYARHKAHRTSEAPLTEREKEMASLKEAEGIEARGTGPRGGAFSTLKGARGTLPWDEEVDNAVQNLAQSGSGAIHLILDVPRETVVLASTSAAGQLAVPTETPSYNIIAHGGQTALVYCCPATSPVKSRMLYSSSVLGVTKSLKQHGIEVKRLETSEPVEITSDWLDSELGIASAPAPASPPPTTSFARPKRPGARKPTAPSAAVALPEQTTSGETVASLP